MKGGNVFYPELASFLILVKIAKQTVKKLLDQGKNPAECTVLVMGFTFKEDVSDIRNTRVADLVKELESYKVKVDVVDPVAKTEEVMEEYGIVVASDLPLAPSSVEGEHYDSVIVAVAHKEYKALKAEDFSLLINRDGILVDVKGAFRGLRGRFKYWSL